MANIQWFPGHMNKARIMIEENIKHVDLVVELRDARIPFSSANPLLNSIINQKKRLIILNKKDLADQVITQKWIDYYKAQDISAVSLDVLHDKVSILVPKLIKESCQDILDRAKRRGIFNKTLKVMVVGIPNVGKSSFINKIVKKSVTKVENRPGVTKKINWIRIHPEIDLLDTPGVLWPSFENQSIGLNLGLIGSINDQVMDKEELVNHLMEHVLKNYPQLIEQRYQVELQNDIIVVDLLYQIGQNKFLIDKDAGVDYPRVYDMLLSDLRNNRLGRISYELPE